MPGKEETSANSKNAKVGIVTPAHNSGKTIKDTIASILEQTYPDFEVFVVDDHSTDNTVEVVNELCGQDERVHLLRLEKEKGAAAARNLAIKCIEDDTSLEYVAFLDSDDLWRKDKLETQVEFMKRTGALFSYGDYDICDEATGKIYGWRKCPNKVSYLRMLIGCSVGCLTVMYNKKAVGHISIPNLAKRNDYALWCIILKKVRRGYKYPGNLAIYKKSENSISSGNKIFLVKHHYRMHREANEFGPIKAGFFTVMNVMNYMNNIVIHERKNKKADKDRA